MKFENKNNTRFKIFQGELNFFTVFSLFLYALFSLFYFFPFVPYQVTEYLSNSLGEVVFLSIVTISSLSTINLSQDAEEQRFWFAFQLAMLIWWFTYLASFIFPDSGSQLPGAIMYDGANYIIYLLLITMVEFNQKDFCIKQKRIRLKNWWIGLGVASLLFVILIIIQAFYFPENYATWYPSLIYYTCMDIYLLSRFFISYLRTSVLYWKGVYFWLSMAALGWAISDTTEMILQGDIDFWTQVSRTDPLWWIPFLFLIFAATRSADK
ncbi:MAG TPA: hypothetical protein ENJ60_06665 [Aeromonadales bacterium]|nr:hypothetical protein [Aeromonadales bacterium]